MNTMQNRVAALHDISGFGRCSLTTAIATLSAMGVQCCPVVGAVLSAHTMYKNVTVRDLTDDLPAYVRSLAENNVEFHAIYTGYMCRVEQIPEAEYLFENCAAQGCILFVDPVMGDNGKPYTGKFGVDFAAKMKELCALADIITPNLTEAMMLLGDAPDSFECDEAHVRTYLERLMKIGCKAAVITGVDGEHGKIGAGFIDSKTNEIGFVYSNKIDAYFPGTGDLFASVLLGTLLQKKCTLGIAVANAVDFVYKCIERTKKMNSPARDGVLLEEMLPILWESLK